MALTTGIITVAASSAPLVKEGMTSLKKLVDVHRPSRNELLGPAATYQASAPCVVADQERVLRHLGVGRVDERFHEREQAPPLSPGIPQRVPEELAACKKRSREILIAC